MKRAGNRLDWISPCAEDFRAEADKWERLAVLADEDGDQYHAAEARKEAAQLRQEARKMEVDARP